MPRDRRKQMHFQPEAAAKLLDALKAGSTLEAAAGYAALEVSMVQPWLKAGDQGDRTCRQFAAQVRQSQAAPDIRAAASLTKAVKDNWQAADRFLRLRLKQQQATTKREPASKTRTKKHKLERAQRRAQRKSQREANAAETSEETLDRRANIALRLLDAGCFNDDINDRAQATIAELVRDGVLTLTPGHNLAQELPARIQAKISKRN